MGDSKKKRWRVVVEDDGVKERGEGNDSEEDGSRIHGEAWLNNLLGRNNS